MHWFALVVPYRFRRLHHWYARGFGFYWHPCLTCGREYGGHEHMERGDRPASIRTSEPGVHRMICPVCTLAGRGQPMWP